MHFRASKIASTNSRLLKHDLHFHGKREHKIVFEQGWSRSELDVDKGVAARLKVLLSSSYFRHLGGSLRLRLPKVGFN